MERPEEMGWQPDPQQYHVTTWQASDPEDGWVTVRDGGLPRPVRAKFAIVDGEFRLIGLRIDDGERITGRLLRSLRVEALEGQYAAYVRAELDEAKADVWHAEHLVEQFYPHTDGLEADLKSARDYRSQLLAWYDRLPRQQTELQPRGRGAAPPSEEEYQAFARVYLEELMEHPRTAIKATAERLNINRSTVYRWIEECRAPGRAYLPPKGAEQS